MLEEFGIGLGGGGIAIGIAFYAIKRLMKNNSRSIENIRERVNHMSDNVVWKDTFQEFSDRIKNDISEIKQDIRENKNTNIEMSKTLGLILGKLDKE